MDVWNIGERKEDKLSAELRNTLGIGFVLDALRRGRLRWMDHVLRKDENTCMGERVMNINVEKCRPRERPSKVWIIVTEEDMRVYVSRRRCL